MNEETIPADLQEFVRQQVESGSYASEQSVIIDGLRLLRQWKLDQLRRQLDIGVEQLERGEGIVLEDDAAIERFFQEISEARDPPRVPGSR